MHVTRTCTARKNDVMTSFKKQEHIHDETRIIIYTFGERNDVMTSFEKQEHMHVDITKLP